jgi:hypothetical protein
MPMLASTWRINAISAVSLSTTFSLWTAT